MDRISDVKIKEIYNEFVLCNNTEEYKNRYVPLPVHKNNKQWRWEKKDFPRVISLLEFERYIEKYDLRPDKILTVNGITDPEIEYLAGRYKQISDVVYEDNNPKTDLHTLDLPIKDFDLIILSQTYEHIYNPQQCIESLKKHLKPGGYLYINVPACNAPHSEPFHYFTGYTPMGLAATVYQAGLQIKEIGQWGNVEYLVKLWTRNPGWSEYRHLQNPGLNEFDNPVITWGLFQL